MTKLDIRRIITRYINQEASQEELAILYEWVKKGNNKEVFKKLVQADYLVNYEDRPWDTEVAFEQFLHTIKSKENGKVKGLYSRPYLWKYAAIAVIFLGSSLYFLLNQQLFEKVPLNVGPDQITLELDNGEVLVLKPSSNNTVKSKNGTTEVSVINGVLTQRDNGKTSGSTRKNTLSVPIGERLSVTLDDGSVVMLNAGSTMTYPSSFEGADRREVLVTGEAYFEVAKNPNKPFIVRTSKMYTQVYGTVFNVSAYPEDEINEVVLVEGSVGVGTLFRESLEGEQMLKPSQKASSNPREGNEFLIEDVDVSPYISWTKGILVFENEPMGKIIKRLERHYGIQIDNRFEQLEERRFTGMFDEENIDRVLRTIQAHTQFSYYLKNEMIIINEPHKQ
ncbi:MULTISPECIES: FecR family protein [Flavobacteriaceae]|jgi:ferric-dicitrate binding protein FerR (iron transport regulator)|uniref:FecR domain-containing protein n=1 Tax=Flagellimonas sp. MMG031 TaxID=3158549 RepID=A0AAU7N4R4_9FLAO|nr:MULTISPECIES: FecR domain-containing protein [unclassified Allomuricauda]MBO6828869.1 FecR domain-containing protein [Allomuricauda sp.]NYJ28674.1 ferric-dicitrate binding protein FerR (iron transport regulator) [Muricauda sp. ARW1Y1]